MTFTHTHAHMKRAPGQKSRSAIFYGRIYVINVWSAPTTFNAHCVWFDSKVWMYGAVNTMYGSVSWMHSIRFHSISIDELICFWCHSLHFILADPLQKKKLCSPLFVLSENEKKVEEEKYGRIGQFGWKSFIYILYFVRFVTIEVNSKYGSVSQESIRPAISIQLKEWQRQPALNRNLIG